MNYTNKIEASQRTELQYPMTARHHDRETLETRV